MKTKLLIIILAFLCSFGPAFALTMTPPRDDIESGVIRPKSLCDLSPSKGPCKAMFEKFFYNQDTNQCQGFFWGGCEGVVPFDTKEECENTCMKAPQTLKITRIQAIKDVYAEISLEFPKQWDKPFLQIKVDGREINAQPRSGGYSQDRHMESLLFFPGTNGTKKVTVSAEIDGKSFVAETSLKWNPQAFAAPLQYIGDRTLVLEKRKIQVVTANLNNVAIIFNGQKQAPDSLGNAAVLWTLDAPWKTGLNSLTIEGKNLAGKTIKKSYTYLFGPDGISIGHAALLEYGMMGSKSGPFYSVTVEGDAVTAGPEKTTECFVMDKDGWLGSELKLTREIKAVKAGSAKIAIFEKPHFLQEKKITWEITITVLPDRQ
jgi:hypothetical protein